MNAVRKAQAPIVLCLMVIGVGLLTGSGCNRGRTSSKPPIHPIPNMDNQPRYETQGPGPFFADGMAMRHPVEGTIARGHLITDLARHTGRDSLGRLVWESPESISMELLNRGKDRFNIFCTPCHGRAGDGKGAATKRGMLSPPTFHQERLRNIQDGHLFDVITNGKGNMSAHRHQVPVSDRWAIVAFIRALQRSQNASIDDLPPTPTPLTEENPTR
jgi:hypothetical protein